MELVANYQPGSKSYCQQQRRFRQAKSLADQTRLCWFKVINNWLGNRWTVGCIFNGKFTVSLLPCSMVSSLRTGDTKNPLEAPCWALTGAKTPKIVPSKAGTLLRRLKFVFFLPLKVFTFINAYANFNKSFRNLPNKWKKLWCYILPGPGFG